MILKGNQRGGGKQLALHLMNGHENDHVEIHEVSGFVSNDLVDAFTESYAISQGTRCKQFLFSLSLNPPELENVPIEVFESAIDRIEQSLGLSGQPRAVVFHEKEGRRHAHCVWSRIDVAKMRAINHSHYKRKLNKISHELYLENQWELPEGFKRKQDRSPLNMDRAEWQQGKRTKQDPKALKQLFLKCWERSDSRPAFAAALREYGLILAKGDRRGHVAVDKDGNVYAISRWVGVKAKEVRTRFGTPDDLPSVDEAVKLINQTLDTDNKSLKSKQSVEDKLSRLNALFEQKETLKRRQQQERKALRQKQEKRQIEETKARAGAMPKGIRAVWSSITGQSKQLAEIHRIQTEDRVNHDRLERQALIVQHMKERRDLQFEITQARYQHQLAHQLCIRELGTQFKVDPTQALITPVDETLSRAAEIRKNPVVILDVITDKEEWFSHADIKRTLEKFITDSDQLAPAIEVVLKSEKLIHKSHHLLGYTTQEMQRINQDIENQATTLINTKGFGTPERIQKAAIQKHHQILNSQVGANLSDEQTDAIRHLLDNEQLSIAVGIAGAGKSTMLSAANEAWQQQGRRVMGGALSGKAADGLQASSNIESRTLASWMYSWKEGYHEPQSGDIFVLDEAGMVGSKQLLSFIEATKQYNMKLVLVGDPEQLQPINAGTPLKQLTEKHRHAILKTVLRQREPWQRKATLDFAENRTDQAMQAYEVNGAVTNTGSLDRAMSALVEDYMRHVELNGENESRIVLAHRRKDVHKLNQYIRMAKQSAGELNQEARIKTNHGERAFAKGDRIVFTENNHSIGVRNGLLGTIERVTNKSMTVKLDERTNENDIVNFDVRSYKSFDHGYATTIHKSQGVTVDLSFVLSSKSLDRHLTYVAMTRHRHSVKLYRNNQHLNNQRISSYTKAYNKHNDYIKPHRN